MYMVITQEIQVIVNDPVVTTSSGSGNSIDGSTTTTTNTTADNNITNTSLKSMGSWIKNRIVAKYSLSPDFDNRWRTGGSVDQIIAESRLDSLSILNAVKRFSDERDKTEIIENYFQLHLTFETIDSMCII